MLRPPSFFKSQSPQVDTRPQSHRPPADDRAPDPQTATKLEDQLVSLTTEHAAQTRELNQRITQHLTDIQFLKSSLNDRETAFSREKTSLEGEYANTICGLQEENGAYSANVHELESILAQQQQDKQEMEQQMYFEREENIRLKQSISSIVSYPEREQGYKNAIAELDTQLDHNLKQIHFLNLRLDALQDILRVQERNLTQNSDESIGKLLATWRGKVFELLMRKKYFQIDAERGTKQFEAESIAYKDTICKLENESELQKLCINERSAQIESLTGDVTVVTGQNRHLSICVSSFENLENIFRHSTQNSLAQLTKLSHRMDDLYGQQVGKITLLHHRIAFLKDRVGFLVDYLAQNQTRFRPSHDKSVQSSFPDSCLNHMETTADGVLSLPHGTLVNEIQLLVRERSILRNKMRENSDFSKQELQRLRQDSTSEIEKLKSELEQTTQESFRCGQENEFYQVELEKLHKINGEEEARIQRLESKLLENNNRYEQERSLLCQDLQQKHSESLNELENRLREAGENYSHLQGQLDEAYNSADEQRELAIGSLKLENQDLRRKLEETRLHLQAMEAEKSILSLSLRTVNSSQHTKQPLIEPSDLQEGLISQSPLPSLNTDLHKANHDEETPSNDKDTYGITNKMPPVPNHVVPASELVSMVHALTQLSSQIFSL